MTEAYRDADALHVQLALLPLWNLLLAKPLTSHGSLYTVIREQIVSNATLLSSYSICSPWQALLSKRPFSYHEGIPKKPVAQTEGILLK